MLRLLAIRKVVLLMYFHAFCDFQMVNAVDNIFAHASIHPSQENIAKPMIKFVGNKAKEASGVSIAITENCHYVEKYHGGIC